ncbi:hypothetical protein Shyhy01_34990 [Streptomyces hygroscopicus subsp. hygroscopicus]|uniref:hypothetical protein n=1 Tax=Streptomyces sp. KHY 26 TaxID=3097359 RepID=UPI0024A06E5F|nr:hypothetical protein [Streptomyces hygroscopicus]GLX50549.1 hypothetical protein Shyhy01_34990 [Streptomyces hygroscopicus subsp. hygroscopicus]
MALYLRQGSGRQQVGGRPTHNGRRGWTPDHHEDDKRGPVRVSTLSSEGHTLAGPGSGLPYDHDIYACASPKERPEAYQHDFGHVVTIDRGRVPAPAARRHPPLGRGHGGRCPVSYPAHRGGTPARVSMPRNAMEVLLRTLARPGTLWW